MLTVLEFASRGSALAKSAVSPPNDKWIGPLVGSGLASQRLVAPSVDGTLFASDRRLRLSTTMWVISGRLYDTSYLRLSTETSVLASLSELFVFMVAVTDLTNGCAAGVVNHPHFTAGQSKSDICALLRHDLGGSARAANHLATATGLQFDVVNQGTKGNILDLEAVAGQNVCVGTTEHPRPHFQAFWGKDIGLGSVHVVEQRNATGAIGIVFNRDDLGLDALFDSLEINDSIALLVSTASLKRGDAAGVVSSTGLRLWCN